ncbi:unnamed protein product [Lymnaea stagnalis]|uniref:Uncharacterized protein n=1 Tax=Lymnaea stagnalis TaxID=6523 RepID=A0AAV2HEH7_LYMST
MYYLVLVQLGLMVFGIVNSQGIYDNPCTLFDSPSRYFDKDGVMYLTVPVNCVSGDVYWNYPQGSIVLNATRSSTDVYALCIDATQGTEFAGLWEITGGVEEALEIPTEENGGVCIKNIRGEAAVKITAPSLRRYLTIFKYRIQYPAP